MARSWSGDQQCESLDSLLAVHRRTAVFIEPFAPKGAEERGEDVHILTGALKTAQGDAIEVGRGGVEPAGGLPQVVEGLWRTQTFLRVEVAPVVVNGALAVVGETVEFALELIPK